MKRQLLIWLAAGMLLPVAAEAQNTITFSSHSSASKKKHKREYASNSLTIGIGSFVNGFTALYYERRLNDVFAVSVGGGITYRSYWNELGMTVWNDGVNSKYYTDGNDVKDDYTSYKYRKPVPSIYLSVMPKYYFGEHVMDGAYIGPMIEFKQYRTDAQLPDDSYTTSPYYGTSQLDVPRMAGTLVEHLNCLDVTFNIGGHHQARNHVVVGWNFGIGFRQLHAQRQDLGFTESNTGTGTGTFTNVLTDNTAIRPVINLNFVIGGCF